MKNSSNPSEAPAENGAMFFWLLCVYGFVFAMVVIGAITRLTESGLSMVEWRPLIGTFPPMSEAEWRRVFDLYKETPEFQKKNFWMEISDFKTIFFWEWFHRFWGRVIGIVYAVPLIYFWVSGKIPKGFKPALLILLALGASQAVMGWWMVESGLVDRPDVSHYRLAAHLFLAFIIMGALLWVAQDIRGMARLDQPALYKAGWAVMGILSLTILWGAFTAGLNAGLIYNDSFPLMDGQFIPPDFNQITPAWLNVFETPSAIQFMHRWLATATLLAVLAWWGMASYKGQTHNALHALVFFTFFQYALGIGTLMSNVEINHAAAHQAFAVILFSLVVMSIRSYAPARS